MPLLNNFDLTSSSQSGHGFDMSMNMNEIKDFLLKLRHRFQVIDARPNSVCLSMLCMYARDF
jgi:hypothetical protein